MAKKDVQSESSKLEQENERLDAEQEAGYKRYMQGEKTRLKDQGSLFGSESPGASRTRKEAALKNKTMLGLYAEEKNIPRRLKNLITGEDDYGTSLSKGAMQAADKAAKEYRGEASGAGRTRGQVDSAAMDKARKAASEAAAEERREARGMKKGGKVSSASSRADGCCTKGKTKGRMV